MNRVSKIYDKMSRILTEYEEGIGDSNDLYEMLVEIQNSWESDITACENEYNNNPNKLFTLNKLQSLFEKALERISGEYIERDELLKVFRDDIGMTDEEIDYFGFDFSDLEQDNRISVFCLKDDEDAVFYTTAIPNDLYCVASTYHYYMKNDVGRLSLDSLAECFSDMQFVDEQVFSVLCSAISNDKRIASLIEFDFDSKQLKYCDSADGVWRTYDLQDISEAVIKSSNNNDLNYSARKNIFLEHLDGQEINDTTETQNISPSITM